MTNNPLQQYFRQPKIFVSLPSLGIYNRPGSLDGDISNMPVFGMTGMDEILMKTPDALMSGESTVKVIQSCCPNIKDAWDISSLDLELVLVAIRIATFGNIMEITSDCTSCGTENVYSIDLSKLIDHFSSFKFKNKLMIGDLTLSLNPINYRQSTRFSLKNFELQQKLTQIAALTDKVEQNTLLSEVFAELSELQTQIFTSSIDSIDTGMQKVSDRQYINEWIRNCDKSYVEKIKDHINESKAALQMPPFRVKCDNCGAENNVIIDLDQSNFFANA